MVAMENDSNQELNASERQSQIARMVREQGKVFISDLVRKYDLTETSIRRDLVLLEEEHRPKRIHGGAASIPGNFHSEEVVQSVLKFFHCQSGLLFS